MESFDEAHRAARCAEGAGRRPRDRRLRHRLLVAPLPAAAARSNPMKIEKSFVDGIGLPGEEPDLLRAIIDLAQHLRPTGRGRGDRAAGAARAVARARMRARAGPSARRAPRRRRRRCPPVPRRPARRAVRQRQATRRRARRLRSSDRSIVARIESYSPGRIVIDGVEHHTDVIVLPDRVLGTGGGATATRL